MSATIHELYPAIPHDRDRWILSRRTAPNYVDPWKPSGFFVEEERSDSGEIVPVATILLANRECPWRCLMCDLWKNTLAEKVPVGAIPAQISLALDVLKDRNARQIKLYNSGSFFDPQAIPPEDYSAITQLTRGFERTIVECHPALIRETAARFNDAIEGKLEVAMGLETAHPEILEQLNKRMTLDMFRTAAEFLRKHGIALRVFVLVKPPFMSEAEAFEWACRSIDFAFDCGASLVSLIPTRPGNGAMESLEQSGDFSKPKLETLEAALRYGIGLQRGRVFADLWDLKQFVNGTPAELDLYRQRLDVMNRTQSSSRDDTA